VVIWTVLFRALAAQKKFGRGTNPLLDGILTPAVPSPRPASMNLLIEKG